MRKYLITTSIYQGSKRRIYWKERGRGDTANRQEAAVYTEEQIKSDSNLLMHLRDRECKLEVLND